MGGQYDTGVGGGGRNDEDGEIRGRVYTRREKWQQRGEEGGGGVSEEREWQGKDGR